MVSSRPFKPFTSFKKTEKPLTVLLKSYYLHQRNKVPQYKKKSFLKRLHSGFSSLHYFAIFLLLCRFFQNIIITIITIVPNWFLQREKRLSLQCSQQEKDKSDPFGSVQVQKIQTTSSAALQQPGWVAGRQWAEPGSGRSLRRRGHQVFVNVELEKKGRFGMSCGGRNAERTC